MQMIRMSDYSGLPGIQVVMPITKVEVSGGMYIRLITANGVIMQVLELVGGYMLYAIYGV